METNKPKRTRKKKDPLVVIEDSTTVYDISPDEISLQPYYDKLQEEKDCIECQNKPEINDLTTLLPTSEPLIPLEDIKTLYVEMRNPRITPELWEQISSTYFLLFNEPLTSCATCKSKPYRKVKYYVQEVLKQNWR